MTFDQCDFSSCLYRGEIFFTNNENRKEMAELLNSLDEKTKLAICAYAQNKVEEREDELICQNNS